MTVSSTLPSAKPRRFVSYLRVSTAKQGASGLGLEAQREAVEAYLRANNGSAQLLAEYVEVESGRKADRPQLQEALAHCKAYGAELLVAKLDRLSRSVAFLSNLRESGVEFRAADFPEANRLTVHILAAVAEHERDMIAARTKAALGAAKARGVRLGSPKGAAHLKGRGNREAAQAVVLGADERARRLRSVLERLEAEGISSAQAQARALNERGVPTARGGKWSAQSVLNLRMRLVAHGSGSVRT